MTKEELEKEVEEYIKANNLEWELECYRTSPIGEVKQAYIASAEPREKHIAELKKQLDLKEKALSKAKKETKRIADRVNKDKRRLIRRKSELEAENEQIKNSDTLCKLIGEQKIKITELEAQVEKLKCCGNCENGELSAHEEPCLHCQRCFASKDVTDQENVKDNWEAIKEIKDE